MKKFVLISIAALGVFAACSKNELISASSSDEQIKFETAVNKSTKALINGTAYATTNTFGTVAYKVNGADTQLYIPVSEVSYTAGTPAYWSTAAPYYWPKQGTLTFYSYSPFSYQETAGGEIAVAADENGLKFADYNVADHQLTDLMTAEKQSGLSASNASEAGLKDGVKTVFHHKLAQVVAINFETVLDGSLHDYANGHTAATSSAASTLEAGDKVFIINKVELKNIKETATLTCNGVDASTWGSYGTATPTVAWHNNADSKAFEAGKYDTTCDVNGYRLVLPQTHEAGAQNIYFEYTIRTYTDGTNYAEEKLNYTAEFKALQESWEQNKRYTYTFKIGLDRIYWVPSVVDWVDETVAGPTI